MDRRLTVQAAVLYLCYASLMASYTHTEGGVVSRTDKVSDLELHYERIADLSLVPFNPMGRQSGYYSPLLHWFIGGFNYLTGLGAAYSMALLVPLILVVFLPHTIYQLTAELYGTREAYCAAMLYLLVGVHTNFYLFTSTYPQGLNMALILLALYYMAKENKLGLAATSVGVVLSHSTGILYYTGVLTMYLLWKRKTKLIGLLAAMLATLFGIENMVRARVMSYYSGFIGSGLQVRMGKFLALPHYILWINPVLAVLAAKELGSRRIKRGFDYVMLAALAIPLLAFTFDSALRPLLNLSTLLSIYAAPQVIQYEKSNTTWLFVLFMVVFNGILVMGNMLRINGVI